MDKRITYDHITRDFLMELDGQFIGYAATHAEAEERLNAAAYRKAQHAPATPPEQPQDAPEPMTLRFACAECGAALPGAVACACWTAQPVTTVLDFPGEQVAQEAERDQIKQILEEMAESGDAHATKALHYWDCVDYAVNGGIALTVYRQSGDGEHEHSFDAHGHCSCAAGSRPHFSAEGRCDCPAKRCWASAVASAYGRNVARQNVEVE
jgi:hypothetical protein